ncbi:MAG: hypothetical protein WAV15_02710 [Minisyncoccia bacterium]
MRRFVLLFVLFSLLSSSVEAASRRRAVRFPSPEPVVPPAPAVTTVLTVIYEDPDGNGVTNAWVGAQTLGPAHKGAKFVRSVKKPGDNAFSLLGNTVVEAHQDGMYRTFWLFYGEEFYDQLPDGTKLPWRPGIAIYKVEETSPEGLVTESYTQVQVPLRAEPVAGFGPLLKAVPTADGKRITLYGVFATPPVAMLYHREGPGLYRSQEVKVINNEVQVPEGMAGQDSPLVVCAGYSAADCNTVEVDIPNPPKF